MTSEKTFIPCDGCSGHDCDDGCAYPGVNEAVSVVAENATTDTDLKAENERYKHALEFYADKANWDSGDFQHSVDEHLGHNVLTLNMPQAVNDQGKIARAALNVEASHG